MNIEHTEHMTRNGQEYQRRYFNSELRAHKRTTLGEVINVLLRSKRDVLPTTTDMLQCIYSNNMSYF
jgi:hypothetical protein